MPNIYDNLEAQLLPALREAMADAQCADFCVGYFNLRGWEHLADLAERFSGADDSCCRILVGMQKPAEKQMREAYRAIRREQPLDAPTIAHLRKQAGESFRMQLAFGIPTNQAETALKRLAEHLRARKVRVKLFLRHALHAKLYLVHRPDTLVSLLGFVGSSNLTQAGLLENGELNVDVLEQDAANKLHMWFHKHWDDKYSFDISEELAQLIEESWATADMVRPYLVYLKMVYHLSEDARLGEKEFKLPRDLRGKLLTFQTAAVSLAARHLHARGGVLLGDVVGLGKTFMAVAVARILQEDEGGDTLIICPPNLQQMWQEYVHDYKLIARVLPISKAQDELPEMRRYRLLVIDESHNLRNREGARYAAIRDYIERNEPRCLLVTATPYNKAYLDLSNQLRLFIDERRDLGVRPEKYFQEYDEADFAAEYQASPRSLRAFEESEHADDWRDLMRLYMVRRTRRFIIDNYAQYDAERDRHFVLLPDGTKSYFPKRSPHNLQFKLNDDDPSDQYARLYRQDVVDIINWLHLPRYGLAQYLDLNQCQKASQAEAKIIQDLGRAGRRLMGFCRTNLFKRLESSGDSFLLSLRRHVLRNMIVLHALRNGLPVPIGTQDVALLDTATTDADQVAEQDVLDLTEDDEATVEAPSGPCDGLEWYERRAAEVYDIYRTELRRRFRWLPTKYFGKALADHLHGDAKAICGILKDAGEWDPKGDAKLEVLQELLSRRHGLDKVLIFTQFADTAVYLARQLKQRGFDDVAAVTGASDNPTHLAHRFSPRSNNYTIKPNEMELRALIATDVLSEGQNLQDCHVVVNYDLPWAIIRLVQRAGRVDRIGQGHDSIDVYSFLPADGVERIIRLHTRLRQRLMENNEVVGSDEQFFDEQYENKLRDLYTERASSLEEPADAGEVDLASMALQVWKSAPESDRKAALALPPMVNATRAHDPTDNSPAGILAYLRTAEGNDALVRINTQGEVVSQSLAGILDLAACSPETPPQERDAHHHDWVQKAVEAALTDENLTGGALGPPRSIRRRVYERMKAYFDRSRGTLFATEALERAISAIYAHQLTPRARETLGRQLRLGVSDETLADIVTALYEDQRLVFVEEAQEVSEPEIVCSIGLKEVQGDSNAN
jgi:superfamily II DNA or RNA helicase